MALKPCRECKKEISTDANPCPHCGKKSPHGTSPIVAVGGTFIAIFGAYMFLKGGSKTVDSYVASEMHDIENQVANDSVQQYEIAKRSGDPMQACVHAGMVSAAFLQAKDEPNYRKWQAIEKTDCAAAGMPH